MLHRLSIQHLYMNNFRGKTPKKHITKCNVIVLSMVNGEGEGEGEGGPCEIDWDIQYIQRITLELNWHHRTAWELWEDSSLWYDVALGLWKANMHALLCQLHLQTQLKSIVRDNSKERERQTKKGELEHTHPSHNVQVGKAEKQVVYSIFWSIFIILYHFTCMSNYFINRIGNLELSVL